MLDPVQLADPETVTLARCIGEPTHRSLQQRKLEHRGIRTTEELVALAVQRGCTRRLRFRLLTPLSRATD
jgi:hypothetical protein